MSRIQSGALRCSSKMEIDTIAQYKTNAGTALTDLTTGLAAVGTDSLSFRSVTSPLLACSRPCHHCQLARGSMRASHFTRRSLAYASSFAF